MLAGSLALDSSADTPFYGFIIFTLDSAYNILTMDSYIDQNGSPYVLPKALEIISEDIVYQVHWDVWAQKLYLAVTDFSVPSVTLNLLLVGSSSQTYEFRMGLFYLG